MQNSHPEIKIIAVVLHYNSVDTLVEVLKGIQAQTRTVDFTIVVDNGSHQDLNIFSAEDKSVRLIRLATNAGVGAGHNCGWRIAITDYQADFIWSLEHDSIPRPDCLEKLLDHYRTGEFHALCPVEEEGFDYDNYKYYVFRGSGFRKLTNRRKKLPYKGGLSFNGLLLPVDVLKKVGFLNEEFFVGREDIEFFKRIYKQKGYVLKVPEALVVHNLYKERKQVRVLNRVFLFSQQSLMREFYSYRNSVYMSNAEGVPVWRLYVRHILSMILILLFRNNKATRIRNKNMAFANGLKGRLGKLS